MILALREDNLGVKSVILMYFFRKKLLSNPGHISDKMSIVMMTKEGSTKIVNFMTSGPRVLVLRHCHISHIVNKHYFFINLLIYFEHRTTNWVHSNDKLGRVYQNCKFYDTRGRGIKLCIIWITCIDIQLIDF